MSETPETDAFIEGLNDDWDVEFAALTTHAKRMEAQRNQWRECAEALAKELISSRIDTAWDWESPAMKQYNQLMKHHEHDA
jgi:hypothetical protein